MSGTAVKRVVAINDISCFGKCSLTVALPVVSASGVECACIPTALLSTHTGCFSGYTCRDLAEDILPIAEHWAREGLCFDGIFTGYMASPGQAALIARAVRLLRTEETLVLVDPAMADHGKYYSGLDEGIAEAFRLLLPEAQVITPNLTEACALCGVPFEDTAKMSAKMLAVEEKARNRKGVLESPRAEKIPVLTL